MKDQKIGCVRSRCLIITEQVTGGELRTEGGIVLPHHPHSVTNAMKATVVAVAEDVRQLRVGDTIVINRAYGAKFGVPWDDLEYKIVSEDQVDAVVEV